MKRDGLWARLAHRLTTDADDLDAEEMQRGRHTEGTCACIDATAGQLVSVEGRLRSVQFTPSERTPVLTAELFDGSGSLQLVWLGQRRIPGIEPGRRLRVRGRVAERSGECAIYNPWYELHDHG